MTDKRAIFYIDGFNFYYLRLKDSPHFRWLNLKLLGDQIVPNGTCAVAVKYFTAVVSGKTDMHEPARQKAYLDALNTIPEVKIIKGRFVFREKWATLVQPLKVFPEHPARNLPPLQKAKIIKPEEKGTDVNLASHLIWDACTDKFDVAYVITNDTDLVEPIRIVTQELGKKVVIVAPRQHTERRARTGKKYSVPIPNVKLKTVATSVYVIQDNDLQNAQFKDTVAVGKGKKVIRPKSW